MHPTIKTQSSRYAQTSSPEPFGIFRIPKVTITELNLPRHALETRVGLGHHNTSQRLEQKRRMVFTRNSLRQWLASRQGTEFAVLHVHSLDEYRFVMPLFAGSSMRGTKGAGGW